MPAYEVEIEHRETDQVFSYHHDDAPGGMLHFNTSLLARLRAAMPVEFKRITMDIGEAEYTLVMEHRGIEEAKVAALTARDLREPGYMVFLPNGTVTMVDGHHRLVRRYRAGARTMDLWVTHDAVWRHCLVPYSAEEQAILEPHIPPRVDNAELLVSKVTIKPESKP